MRSDTKSAVKLITFIFEAHDQIQSGHHPETSITPTPDLKMAPALSPPTFSVLVLYPREKGSYFNLKYYLESHIPLAERLWGPFGMGFHSITPYENGQGECHLSCVMDWESKDAFDAAQQSAGTKEIMDDVGSGNITDVKPTFLSGTVAK